MTARVRRGLEIAAQSTLRQRGDGWVVQAKTQKQPYHVGVGSDGTSHCTCPDYRYRKITCKHVYAVAITLALQTITDIR